MASTDSRGRWAPSLRLKWTLALLGAAIVPLAAIGARVLHIQHDALFGAEQSLELSVVDQAARTVERSFDDMASSVRQAALFLGESSIQDDDARLALAQRALRESDLVAWASLADADGKPIGTVLGNGATPHETEVRSERRWSLAWSADGSPDIRVVEPILAGGARTGFLIARLRADRLATRVADLSRVSFGRDDGLFLVDQGMRVLAGDHSRRPAGMQLAGAELFAKVTVEADAPGPYVKTASWVASDGTPMVGTLRALPQLGMVAVVERREAEAFGALEASRRALALVALAATGLAVVVAFVMARRTTRPIEDLTRQTRAYAERRFDAPNEVRTGDELEALGDALSEMASGIAAGEREIARRAVVEADLGRYLPAEVAARVARGDGRVALEGERRQVTVLFADLVAFTGFAERSPPEEVVALLNEVFSILAEVVLRHGGMVDKFIGDCIMAVFGAGVVDGDHVSQGLAAAEDMHRFVEASAGRWKETYDFEVRLGIGVASGVALVGNLGTQSRVDFTAVGDVVNVAARLETLARPGQTLVTGETAARAGDAFEFRNLGLQVIRGKAEQVEIAEVVA